jgi:LacI family transcriptional regulator
VNRNFRRDQHIPRFLLEKNVDGIIAAGTIPSSLVKYIREIGLPFVMVDYLPRSGPVSAVLIDNYDGAYKAVSFLVESGNERIAFVGGDLNHPSIQERYHGYRQALTDSNIPILEELIVDDEFYTGYQDGYKAMCKLLARRVDFSALFACNDAMAQGCLSCMRERRITVPDDIALVGFDDIESDLQIEPRLTTVRVNKEELGAVAVRRLVEMIRTGEFLQGKTLLPTELIIRNSTNKPIRQLEERR